MSSFLLNGNSEENPPLKALIVDTDPKVVRALGAAFQALGGEPLEATTFEAAKQLWIAQKPEILIADVRLGPYNGIQLLLRAKADRPDVVAGIMSSVADRVLEIDTQRYGGTFLVKPLEPKQVLKILLGDASEMKPAFQERRLTERRHFIIPDFMPDRRLGDRRRPKSQPR